MLANRSIPENVRCSAAAQLSPRAEAGRMLGRLCFSVKETAPVPAEAATLPSLHIAAPLLGAVQCAADEVWLGRADVHGGRHGNISYRHDGMLLFGVIEQAENNGFGQAPPLQQAAASAYGRIFSALDALGYPCMHRCWNYLAAINEYSHGLERYQQFNRGRQQAFIAAGREVSGPLPAACALGMPAGKGQAPLKIAFLAGRAPAQAIENPRQVSAYQYPEQYGPSSPAFSRAKLLRLPDHNVLLISGTASIVGHSTRHAGDVLAQLQETVSNLSAVVDEANAMLTESEPRFALAGTPLRVYLRHAQDYEQVSAELRRLLGPATLAAFVQADICRQDLLLEIEASVSAAVAAPAFTLAGG